MGKPRPSDCGDSARRCAGQVAVDCLDDVVVPHTEVSVEPAYSNPIGRPINSWYALIYDNAMGRFRDKQGSLFRFKRRSETPRDLDRDAFVPAFRRPLVRHHVDASGHGRWSAAGI